MWPDTPKARGKDRWKDKPYAITSRRYQEVFEKKKLAKRRAEEEKARKRKHIEAKEKKDKIVPAVTTVKRKLFTKTSWFFLLQLS